jgi:hypothetical protein
MAAAIIATPAVPLLPAEMGSPASAIVASVRIAGDVPHPLVLHDSDLAAFSRQSATVADEKGEKTAYEGVAVFELLKRAGVPTGKQMRGSQMRLYVVAGAADGYRAVFALAEFDPDFTDRIILLVDRRDGRPLSPQEGPFRIIVPGEKRHARWVRQVTALKVEQVP